MNSGICRKFSCPNIQPKPIYRLVEHCRQRRSTPSGAQNGAYAYVLCIGRSRCGVSRWRRRPESNWRGRRRDRREPVSRDREDGTRLWRARSRGNSRGYSLEVVVGTGNAPQGFDDLRDDLMLPVSPLCESAGRDVVLGRDDLDAVRAYCHAMGARFGCPNYERYLFGLPIDKALSAGYLITQRGLRETTPHACAEETARRALELASQVDGTHNDDRPTVLDIFGGVGQIAFSYAGAGCQVHAVENHLRTFEVAVANTKVSRRDGLIDYRCDDGPATLATAVGETRRFTMVHLDPPWRGNYTYDLTSPFRVENLAADVPELVRLGLRVAAVVVLDLPHNLVPMEVRGLAAQTSCRVLVQYQDVADFPPQFGLAHAFFYRSATGARSKANYAQERQHLTIDGHRIDCVRD
jgi:hypothetical protein